MNNIRQLRQSLKFTQQQLADKAKVSLTDLRKWERGLSIPSNNEIINIERALGQRPFFKEEKILNVVSGEGYVTAKPKEKLILERQLVPDQSKIKVLDLFCGAGGFSYGFDRQGDFQVTCGIDLLEDRVKTFHLNHKNAKAICADLRLYSSEIIRSDALNPEVIIGGPPCQGFSSIRPFRNLTEGDQRNTLPEQYLIIVSNIRPKWVVFENVVGLLSHKKGNVLNQVLDGLVALGYKVDWRVINCALFGVPQNRERVFIVANSLNIDFQWPRPSHYVKYRSMAGKFAKILNAEPIFDEGLRPAISVMEAIGDLPEISSGSMACVYSKNEGLTDYQQRMRGNTTSLTLHEATRHSEKMLDIIRLSGKNRSALPEGMTTSGFSSCYSRLSAEEPSTTITVNFTHPSSNRCIHPYQDRALTPREGARLQGFPDDFAFTGNRAQVIKQIGNAVPPIMGEMLASAISRQTR